MSHSLITKHIQYKLHKTSALERNPHESPPKVRFDLQHPPQQHSSTEGEKNTNTEGNQSKTQHTSHFLIMITPEFL